MSDNSFSSNAIGATNDVKMGGPSPTPTRVVTRVILLQKPITFSDVFPLIIATFVYSLLVQMVLSCWKKMHQKSFNIFQLVMVVAFPPLIMIFMRDSLFFVIWLILILGVVMCARKVFFGFMPHTVPGEIYKVFERFFIVSNTAIFFGHVFLILTFFWRVSSLLIALRFLLYSLYISVFAREVVFNLSHIMATKTGYFSKGDIPVVQESSRLCMICTRAAETSEKIFSLSCGHNYHENCIKGWCFIGQNTYCPYCKKGVDVNAFAKDLWEKAELPFKPLMNFIRSTISFFIIIYSFIMIRTK